MSRLYRDFFFRRTVLVTGATGFIGSHLSRALRQHGAEVHAVSRSPHAGNGFHWWQAELAEIGCVRKLLRDIRPEAIFHLSGHVTAAPDPALALSTFESHVASTVCLLTAASEVGCRRIVLTGSLTEPQPGCAEPVPSSPYAAAKWASNAYARMFRVLYQMPVTIVRPFMTYGPLQNPKKIIPYVALSLLRNEVPKLASGSWEADWIYIEDVVEGILAATVAPVASRTIDLGWGALIPVREIVRRIVKLVGSPVAPSFGALPDRPAEEVRAADVAHARETIGWQPTIDIDHGLGLTVAWYREQQVMAGSTSDKKEICQ